MGKLPLWKRLIKQSSITHWSSLNFQPQSLKTQHDNLAGDENLINPPKLSQSAEVNTEIVQWRVGQQRRLQLPNPIIMQLLFANSSRLKKKFLQLRLRDTKSTKSLLELTAKLFLSKAQRWFLQYFWPLLGLSGWPSAMQNSKKKIILQWRKKTFI